MAAGHKLVAMVGLLTDEEWRLLDEFRAGNGVMLASSGSDSDEDLRQRLATIAEKLRVAAVRSTTAGDDGFLVPARMPCPYCENFAGRFAWHGPPATIVEDDLTYTYLAPAALGGMSGHTLVLARRHVETIFDLTGDEEAALGAAIAAAARALRAELDPPGLLIQQNNGVAAFQTVPHVHFHVIPKVPGPFPAAQPAQVIPYEQRARLAAALRRHWGAES